MAKTNPTSLDGRSQKLSKPAWKPKEQPGPSLRPASPPKHNPWRQRQASIVSDQEKPAKPLELKAEEFPVLNNPEKEDKEDKDEKAEEEDKEDQEDQESQQAKQEQTADITSSEQPNPPEPCDASSKASSTTNETQSEGARSPLSRLSTPTRLILEEAADQAAQM
ncbi:hypothetical protein ACHAPV_005417 [Trichoderma viride]